MLRPFTVGALARRLDVPEFRIRRTIDRLFPRLPRAGKIRIVDAGMVPVIQAELRRIGPKPQV